MLLAQWDYLVVGFPQCWRPPVPDSAREHHVPTTAQTQASQLNLRQSNRSVRRPGYQKYPQNKTKRETDQKYVTAKKFYSVDRLVLHNPDESTPLTCDIFGSRDGTTDNINVSVNQLVNATERRR